MSLATFGVRKHVVANLVMFALIGAGLIFGTRIWQVQTCGLQI